MNIAHIEEHSFIYGPGCRFVIWVQGCSIRCKGCWNKEMWAFEIKTLISVDELLGKIESEKNFIEGITILGGEPLDQFAEVLELLVECKKLGLSTMLFTGYEMSKIVENEMSEILNHLDILITERYDKTKRTTNHQWIGSTNQEIHVLTDLYEDYEIDNNIFTEITINENGSITILGFPDIIFLEKLIFTPFCKHITKARQTQAQTKALSKSLQSQRKRKRN